MPNRDSGRAVAWGATMREVGAALAAAGYTLVRNRPGTAQVLHRQEWRALSGAPLVVLGDRYTHSAALFEGEGAGLLAAGVPGLDLRGVSRLADMVTRGDDAPRALRLLANISKPDEPAFVAALRAAAGTADPALRLALVDAVGRRPSEGVRALVAGLTADVDGDVATKAQALLELMDRARLPS